MFDVLQRILSMMNDKISYLILLICLNANLSDEDSPERPMTKTDDAFVEKLKKSMGKAPKIDDKKVIERDTPGEPLNDEDFKRPIKELRSLKDPNILLSAGLFEGDINNVPDDLYNDILVQSAALLKNEPLPRNFMKNARKDKRTRWPNAKIPYVISSKFDDDERSVIASVFKYYQTNTCLK